MAENDCLICGRSIRETGSLYEMIETDDVICRHCRESLERRHHEMIIDGMKVESLYEYAGNIRDLMLQYKEYGDEALFPLFLWPDIKRLKRKYRGFVMVPLPSSDAALAKRGFVPAREIFSLLDLEAADILYKRTDTDQKDRKYRERGGIREVIAARETDRIHGRKVLLVDDIITSGQTLLAGRDLLAAQAREIRALTICCSRRFLKPWEKLLIKLRC